jgi:hypothetical protein
LSSYPWKRTAKSSNSNSKTSEEFQTALHRSTNPGKEFQVAHLVQWVHRLDGVSWSRIFHSAISSGPLFHSPSNIYISLPQQSLIYSSVIGRYYEQTLFSTQFKQIFCLIFKPRSNRNFREYGVIVPVSAASYFPCHSAKQILPNSENLPAEVVF